jgi:hypothetical protein
MRTYGPVKVPHIPDVALNGGEWPTSMRACTRAEEKAYSFFVSCACETRHFIVMVFENKLLRIFGHTIDQITGKSRKLLGKDRDYLQN